jgi:hypothetical protein
MVIGTANSVAAATVRARRWLLLGCHGSTESKMVGIRLMSATTCFRVHCDKSHWRSIFANYCKRVSLSSKSERDRRMIAIAFLFVRTLCD